MDTLPALARLRARQGLSQRQLAARADIAVETISDIERGATTMPQLPTIAKLATALGMDFDELYAALSTPEEASA